jgi:Glyoxalase-like domain
MTAGSTRLVTVVFDAAEPPGLARWWSARLGWPVTFEDADESVLEISADSPVGRVPAVSFCLVTDSKPGKNRVHLDLASQSPEDMREQVDAALAAGAVRVDVGQNDVPWEVLADPEGNEFCILEPRAEYLARGALAAIVMDCADPAAIAPFWVRAAGWPVGYSDDEMVSLRNPEGTLPDLDLLRVPESKQAKNRLHLDVAPGPDADLDSEVEALVGLGARPVDVGQSADVTWRVLADPEGNEFCVLRPR